MAARTLLFFGLTLLASTVALEPCAMAQVEDEQTRDYEDQDRRYYESQLEQQEAEADLGDAEAFLAKAEALVRDRNYWSRTGTRYRLQTDDPDLESRAALDLLESFRSFFDGFWEDRIELRPYEEISRFFLYDSFHKYNQLLGFDARYSAVRPRGHYISAYNVTALHTTADTAAGLADALVHEAAHQLLTQRIFPEGSFPSPWLSEGLASYFGHTFRDKSGRFRAGEVGGKSVELVRGGRGGPSRQATGRLRRARQILRSEEVERGSTVDRLLATRAPGVFYGERVKLNYALSWLLVHFLLHGEEGTHASAFVRYLEAERQGGGGPDALHEELGTTPERLEEALLRHAKKLAVR